jgi:hypothetical protein
MVFVVVANDYDDDDSFQKEDKGEGLGEVSCTRVPPRCKKLMRIVQKS